MQNPKNNWKTNRTQIFESQKFKFIKYHFSSKMDFRFFGNFEMF